MNSVPAMKLIKEDLPYRLRYDYQLGYFLEAKGSDGVWVNMRHLRHPRTASPIMTEQKALDLYHAYIGPKLSKSG